MRLTASASRCCSTADRFTFPMVSDPEMKVFQQWRAFDDFEEMPVHGMFLVDSDGMVRWQDISHEPLNKPAWLLKECERLLKLELQVG